MENLTFSDLEIIYEPLRYTKLKFEDYPIGANGYPSHEYKQMRIQEVVEVMNKVSVLKKGSK